MAQQAMAQQTMAGRTGPALKDRMRRTAVRGSSSFLDTAPASAACEARETYEARHERMPRMTEAAGLEPSEEGHQLLGHDLDRTVVGDHHILYAHALRCRDR